MLVLFHLTLIACNNIYDVSLSTKYTKCFDYPPPELRKKVLIIGLDGAPIDTLTQKDTPFLYESFLKDGYEDSPTALELGTDGLSGSSAWSTILYGKRLRPEIPPSDRFYQWKNPHNERSFLWKAKVDYLLKTASVADWKGINEVMLQQEGAKVHLVSHSYSAGFNFEMYSRANRIQFEQGVQEIRDGVDILFLYFASPDHVAHAWGVHSEQYRKNLQDVDGYLRQVIHELKGRIGEEWTVFVASDHARDANGYDHYPDKSSMRSFLLSNRPIDTTGFPKDGDGRFLQTMIYPLVLRVFE
ncbi:MAG: alkaline phosphatase family protein [Spirochaetota bacterium]